MGPVCFLVGSVIPGALLCEPFQSKAGSVGKPGMRLSAGFQAMWDLKVVQTGVEDTWLWVMAPEDCG